MEKITLIYEWTYIVHGKHFKRNYEFPRIIKGRAIQSFLYDSFTSEKEQNERIKAQMKKHLLEKYRSEIQREFYQADQEEIAKEEVEFYNIREATRWSYLEDFDKSQ